MQNEVFCLQIIRYSKNIGLHEERPNEKIETPMESLKVEISFSFNKFAAFFQISHALFVLEI